MVVLLIGLIRTVNVCSDGIIQKYRYDENNNEILFEDNRGYLRETRYNASGQMEGLFIRHEE